MDNCVKENKKENERLDRITKLLLSNRDDGQKFWEWLSDINGKPLDKKTANKFLFCCILDYQMKAETVWGKGKRFTEETLGDPEDLWGYVTSFSHDEWMSKFKEFSLHRFPKAHERVWRIGKIIAGEHNGDARDIWIGKNSAEILECLYKMRMGKQISNMLLGALLDTKQIDGQGDIKADINVKRVLGRVIIGEEFTVDEAIKTTRMMYPDNPWLLDRELYLIGKEYCLLSVCYCDDCYLINECEYSKTLTPSDE